MVVVLPDQVGLSSRADADTEGGELAQLVRSLGTDEDSEDAGSRFSSGDRVRQAPSLSPLASSVAGFEGFRDMWGLRSLLHEIRCCASIHRLISQVISVWRALLFRVPLARVRR